MDKHSFEFVKSKEKLIKVLLNFENGKLNIASVVIN
jgi:hypothetical protein